MELYIHPYGYIPFRQVCEDFQRAHRPRKCSRSQGVVIEATVQKKTGPDDQMDCNCCFGCSLANIFLKLYAI